MATYGYCPHCFAEVATRTRGFTNAKDTCVSGHVYPSAFTLPTEQLREWAEAVQQTLFIAWDELDDENRNPLSRQDRTNVVARLKRTLELIPLDSPAESET